MDNMLKHNMLRILIKHQNNQNKDNIKGASKVSSSPCMFVETENLNNTLSIHFYFLLDAYLWTYLSFQRMFAKEINKLQENIYTAYMKRLPAYLYRRVIRQGLKKRLSQKSDATQAHGPKFNSKHSYKNARPSGMGTFISECQLLSL